MKLSFLLATALCCVLLVPAGRGAELVVLTPKTWEDYAPQGKEVDCIYDDYVLRNDKIVAVIANPVAGRNANMTVRDVGGCIIDLTSRTDSNDQLSAYYPCGRQVSWRSTLDSTTTQSGEAVQFKLQAAAKEDQPQLELTYTLKDGWPYVLVETEWTNASQAELKVPTIDEVRADTTFEKVANGPGELFWAYDKWWNQAYGVIAETGATSFVSDARLSTITYQNDGKSLTLAPGKKHRLTRRVFPALNLLELKGLGSRSGTELKSFAITVKDSAGDAVTDADIAVTQGGTTYGSGRTDANGSLKFTAPPGAYMAEITALARGSTTVELTGESVQVELPVAGRVVANITSESGGPIPCKVQFRGRENTPDPFFFHQSGEHAVHNLYYSHNGAFEQVLAPGQYRVVISYGPEYDAVFTELEIKQGEATPLKAVLKRTVDTKGWISSDFHSHSSPSGDNTSSQYGRVLNLLCEHLEFAPCTEHNRISTYDTHIQRLKIANLMATCSGMELTGNPLPINHQNAFPLVMKERTQDGGGPLTDVSPEVQIGRLALWDNRSEKVVQQNHPDIGNLFFDKDGNGSPDGGFADAPPHMDVIEVHPPHTIFKPAVYEVNGKPNNNTIVNWMQLLNQGYRIPGVVNTDAHYNFHGSGFLRVYLESPTDEPSKIKTLDVVHAAERGRILMTNGPFMEVTASASKSPQPTRAKMGDVLSATSGEVVLHVRVQCPNWFDIDRVQVFVNGRMDDGLNFTREKHRNRFSSETVKFDGDIAVRLKEDAHLIVAVAGEKSQLGRVMGPDHGTDMPIAVSNPIYVDIDGEGFRPNGDTLDAPLPVKEGSAAK